MRRFVAMMSELGLWVVLLLLFLGGCARTSVEEARAETTATKTQTDGDNEVMKDFALIPREVLFGNPQRAQPRLSPDGKRLSFLAPVDGVLNVWVGPSDDHTKAEPVTKETARPIRNHSWAYTSNHILYSQDTNGDEDWHVYATDVATKETRDLTPIEGVNAQIQEVSHRIPDEILIGLNDRDPQLHDIWRVNVLTGENELLQENGGVAGYLTDDDYNVRLALNYTPNGGQVWLMPVGEGDEQRWQEFMAFGPEDSMTSGPAGFNKVGNKLYYLDSRNRNTGGLFAIDLENQDVRLIADDDRCDAGGVLAHPTEKTIQAVSFTYARREWKVLDESIAEDIEYLEGVEDGEFVVTSRTLDDSAWTVAYILDNGPTKFYRYDRRSERKATFLFNDRDDLVKYPLVKMHVPIIESRDGLNLVCYLSLPPGSDPDGDGRPDHPVPLVLNVHGGPWARDGWGFDAHHQWLANRGYAVLSVNFRGSTGFGKEFVNAADGQWAGTMHDDLLDAVNWAVEEGIALEDEICIMGGSYGGYATLVGLTFTPEVFACGVDIVGPSSLVTLLENVPSYWVPFLPVLNQRVGEFETAAGRAELLEKSPLSHVDRIEQPLLIAQGANDPRVKQLEADQIVQAMEQKGIPVTYVLYPDEGHGFRRPPNLKSFNAVTEAFLAKQLGGRYEPIGDDFRGSTITVPTGVDGVPGLDEALASHIAELAEKAKIGEPILPPGPDQALPKIDRQ